MADFSFIGVCFDKTQTLRTGAAKGPDALRKAFPNMETYIDGTDLADSFVEDLGNIYPRDSVDMLAKLASKLNKAHGTPIILGGDHTVTTAAASVFASRRPKPVNLVVFDAHPDCEDSIRHDGAVRIAAETLGAKNVYLCGVRAFSKSEKEFLDSSGFKIVETSYLKKIRGPTYLSIDFDVLDPSIMPSVGNPEPDGLSIGDVVKGARNIKNVIGADFVEFTPVVCSEREIHAIIASKLIYCIMADIAKKSKT